MHRGNGYNTLLRTRDLSLLCLLPSHFVSLTSLPPAGPHSLLCLPLCRTISAPRDLTDGVVGSESGTPAKIDFQQHLAALLVSRQNDVEKSTAAQHLEKREKLASMGWRIIRVFSCGKKMSAPVSLVSRLHAPVPFRDQLQSGKCRRRRRDGCRNVEARPQLPGVSNFLCAFRE